MRAAIYARVSSDKQREHHTIESQLRDAPAYARSQGWTATGEYIDDGRSAKAGQLEKRDGFARLVADAKVGRFDVVVVVAIDRLTRSEDPVERATVVAMITAHVKLAIVGAGIQDPRTFAGDTYITLQALFAAEENRRRSERAKAGHRTAVSRGRKPAGMAPFGLVFAADQWMEHPQHAPVVREIFDRAAAGQSLGGIARDLNDRGVPRPRSDTWRREKVWQIVRSATYRGEWRMSDRRAVTVPAIVDEETWHRAQDRLDKAKRHDRPRAKYTYLLETLALCGLCGARVNVRAGHAGYPSTYVCSCRIAPRREADRCAMPRHPTAEMDELVWRDLIGLLADPGHISRALDLAARRDENADGWRADLASARRKLERLDATQTAILARFRRGAIGEAVMDVELEASERERAALRRQIATAEAALAGRSDAADQRASIEAAIADLRRVAPLLLEPAARQHVIRRMVVPGGAVIEADGAATVDILPPLSSHGPTSVQVGRTLPTLQIARLRVAR